MTATCRASSFAAGILAVLLAATPVHADEKKLNAEFKTAGISFHPIIDGLPGEPRLHVTIRGGKATDADLKRLGQIASIGSVDIENSGPLTSEGLPPLGALKRMDSLKITGALAHDQTMQTIGKFSQLARLVIRGGNASDAGVQHLAGLENLKEFNFSNDKITGATLGALKNCKKLELIYMFNCPKLADFSSLAELRDIGTLKRVDFTFSKLNDAAARELVRIPSITQAGVGSTLLTDEGLKEFSRLPKLEFLDLSGSKVTPAAIPTLARFKTLNSMIVGTKRFSFEQTQLIRKQLPGCRVDTQDN